MFLILFSAKKKLQLTLKIIVLFSVCYKIVSVRQLRSKDVLAYLRIIFSKHWFRTTIKWQKRKQRKK